MKTSLRRCLLSLLVTCAPFAVVRSAAAQEPQYALGGAVSAFSLQVQGDMEFNRRIGFQAGIGAPFYGYVAGSAGGRYYFTQANITPYVGGLFAIHNQRHDYYYNRHEYQDRGASGLAGPTVGIRFRQRSEPGLGAFVQAEFMQELRSPGYMYPSLGAGIQWWF